MKKKCDNFKPGLDRVIKGAVHGCGPQDGQAHWAARYGKR
jgi:hypothetical protein